MADRDRLQAALQPNSEGKVDGVAVLAVAEHALCCDCLDCLGTGPAAPPRRLDSVTLVGRLTERRERDLNRRAYVPTGRPVGRPRKQVTHG